MPIYEYRCTKCGHQDEVLQKVTERPLTKCPACGKRALQKLMSAPGFHLKGSGWYATDFKHSGSKPADKKAEKKPEAKTESAKTESAKAEPAKTDSAKTEPAKSAPGKTDSTKSESAPASGQRASAACTTD
jgi:putative FmdB family regulatory protein